MDALRSNYFIAKKDLFETPVKNVVTPILPPSSKADNI